ncbi:MAG TPA: hypothetical protein VN577_08170 [Terriglobales bacterium]|nr:hypothetical protein [Terriglobales bacterium]
MVINRLLLRGPNQFSDNAQEFFWPTAALGVTRIGDDTAGYVVARLVRSTDRDDRNFWKAAANNRKELES